MNQNFLTFAPAGAVKFVEACRTLEIRTQVFYARNERRVYTYASDADNAAALELSGAALKSL